MRERRLRRLQERTPTPIDRKRMTRREVDGGDVAVVVVVVVGSLEPMKVPPFRIWSESDRVKR